MALSSLDGAKQSSVTTTSIQAHSNEKDPTQLIFDRALEEIFRDAVAFAQDCQKIVEESRQVTSQGIVHALLKINVVDQLVKKQIEDGKKEQEPYTRIEIHVSEKLKMMASELLSKENRRQHPDSSLLSDINRFNNQSNGKFLDSYILPRVWPVVLDLAALGPKLNITWIKKK